MMKVTFNNNNVMIININQKNMTNKIRNNKGLLLRTTTTKTTYALNTKAEEEVMSTTSSASTGLYDDVQFQKKTLLKFIETSSASASATTEESRVLLDFDGWHILDIRAKDEIDFEGRCSGKPKECALIEAKRVYDQELKRKIYKQEPLNENVFVTNVTKSLMSADTKNVKLIVMDADGGVRAEKAKEILSKIDPPFKNVIIGKGGVNAFKSTWDNNMRRRQLPGTFSRGFDNAMFAESNVVAESFGASGDQPTAWIV